MTENDDPILRKVYRDRKEHRSEDRYRHDRAVPYRREHVKWEELLGEEEDEDERR